MRLGRGLGVGLDLTPELRPIPQRGEYYRRCAPARRPRPSLSAINLRCEAAERARRTG